MKKKIVAGMLGVIVVFGVGYFAGQAGGTETVDTPYSQSASSVVDTEGNSHSQGISEKDENTVEDTSSVVNAEDIQPRSRISNDINLTYSYDL